MTPSEPRSPTPSRPYPGPHGDRSESPTGPARRGVPGLRLGALAALTALALTAQPAAADPPEPPPPGPPASGAADPAEPRVSELLNELRGLYARARRAAADHRGTAARLTRQRARAARADAALHRARSALGTGRDTAGRLARAQYRSGGSVLPPSLELLFAEDPRQALDRRHVLELVARGQAVAVRRLRDAEQRTRVLNAVVHTELARERRLAKRKRTQRTVARRNLGRVEARLAGLGDGQLTALRALETARARQGRSEPLTTALLNATRPPSAPPPSPSLTDSPPGATAPCPPNLRGTPATPPFPHDRAAYAGEGARAGYGWWWPVPGRWTAGGPWPPSGWPSPPGAPASRESPSPSGAPSRSGARGPVGGAHLALPPPVLVAWVPWAPRVTPPPDARGPGGPRATPGNAVAESPGRAEAGNASGASPGPGAPPSAGTRCAAGTGAAPRASGRPSPGPTPPGASQRAAPAPPGTGTPAE
ncbi:hypothetical protein E0L36_11835 [Streptomyces sp. AJS327]|uniref:coiled-coil domain-containing protein n=1 Tax=Streptomyces sp. AJS327 TaxID=2545265 RepID=UPI0015DE716C|nr:hypothetical protein [Streptomyces sp. AJS327]MBA0051559.1 hypothetical protein [Streptomyces sp. AJS327]